MIQKVVTKEAGCTDVFALRAAARWGLTGALAVCALVGCGGGGGEAIPAPRLDDTFAQLEVYEPQSLFVNPSARGVVAERDPLLVESWQPEWSSAVQDPELWRRLHRRQRFDTVLFSGPPNEFHVLAEHLLQSPDWRLAWVDDAAILFRNDGREPWRPAPPEAVGENLEPAAIRAAFLARIAAGLNVVDLPEQATAYLDAARSLDRRNPVVLCTEALIALRNNDPETAAEASRKAWEMDRNNALALQLLTESEIRQGKGDQALEHAEGLRRRHGDSLQGLYLLVRAANAAKFPAREAEYLEELIDYAEREELSTAVLQVFLGQAYAKQRKPAEAIAAFEAALASGELSREQRLDIEDAVQRVRANRGG